MEKRELAEMLNQPIPSDAEASDDEGYNSEDENDDMANSLPELPWYQFNNQSTTIKVWDSFFAFVVLYNNIWVPIAICFANDLFVNKENDWFALDIISHSFWLIAFFINMNRVDFAL